MPASRARGATKAVLKPYNDKPRRSVKCMTDRPSEPEPTPQASLTSAVAPLEDEGTMRDYCLEVVHRLYPGIMPRNDYDISTLAGEVYAWLDDMIRIEYAGWPEGCSTVEEATTLSIKACEELLDQPAQVTGRKPRPGQRHVYVRPIPDCDYSIRLWPGVVTAREFCLDFVHTETGEPTNSPFEYELWSLSDPTTPWLSVGSMQLRSIENKFGVQTRDIRPGEEKFVLKDGLTCMLVRPGKRSLRFTVPIHRGETSAAEVEVDTLDLPKIIG
ncbi:uncharacterized protein B0H18DRAFT_1095186 [Fomitopsis serialis]|uniref:uncharacterized protein n=1 Tax=Fomitopsis serialis TaxID=139415 RepID=UPI002007ED8C|nr:uncharacterized protein B0H18DRAFT_1095186 [Neoantrodia serialis]KAH9924071.1 hypothetical protein B0H18DRAFT_1095186 [Neoantrodia serialis]